MIGAMSATTPWSLTRMTKEKGLHCCNPLNCVARPAGFEPTTPWFVAGGIVLSRCFHCSLRGARCGTLQVNAGPCWTDSRRSPAQIATCWSLHQRVADPLAARNERSPTRHAPARGKDLLPMESSCQQRAQSRPLRFPTRAARDDVLLVGKPRTLRSRQLGHEPADARTNNCRREQHLLRAACQIRQQLHYKPLNRAEYDCQRPASTGWIQAGTGPCLLDNRRRPKRSLL